ncbi:MAG: nucleotidyltransferase domain-containing protein [Endomicrobiales bacterium]|nr:nucleotidyltransferase domain-containing protein [Endomicrobiales bacterium]
MKKNILFFTNHQKVLAFLLSHPSEQFYDRQIANLAKMSRSGTNRALIELAKVGLIEKSNRGRMNYYSVNAGSALIKQLKTVLTLSELDNLIEDIKPYARQIILFGSAAKGENRKESDYDLFVLTSEKDKVNEILLKSGMRENIQPIIVTPNDWIKTKKTNAVFYKEVLSGNILWEKQ